jgi:hypothetical protein
MMHLDINILISVALAVATLAMGYLGFYLTLYPLSAHNRKGIRRFKIWFIALAITAVGLEILQSFRNAAVQKEATADSADLKTMIENEREIHKQETESLRDTIAERERELAQINQEQLSVSRDELKLKYVISVEITYSDGRFNISNKGKTDISLWGTRVGDGPQVITALPRMISPGGSYYLIADQLEKNALMTLGPNGETTGPFEVYIKDALQRKYVVKCILVLVSSNGNLSVHTQNTGAIRQDWPSAGS